MSPDRWARISALTANALELPPPRREAFVMAETEGDDSLRFEVMRLLRSSEVSQARVDSPVLPAGVLAGWFGPADLSAGELLGGRYRILRPLGSGGMGAVYEARDEKLDVAVALKTIRAELAADPGMANRFRREIQLARQVTHPAVCRVFDLAELQRPGHPPVSCLTMELVAGQTLARRLSEHGAWSFSEARPVLRQMAAALAAAHGAGVVHRDFKSANVMLERVDEGWRVKVTDFGLARSQQSGQESSTAVAGTPAYMAPEQLEGAPAGPAADLYSLGVVMYEMACGVRPWEGSNPMETVVQRLRSEVRLPSETNPSIDRRWESIILRLLEVKPENRFPSAEAVEDALAEGPRTGSSRSWRELWSPANRRRLRQRKWLVGAALGVLVACGTLYWRLRGDLVSPEALRWRSQAEQAIENGAYLTARGLLDQTLSLAPDDARALLRQAQVLLSLDQQAPAQQLLLRVAGGRGRGEDLDLLFEGLRGASTREWDRAIAALDRRHGRAPVGERSSAAMDILWVLQRADRAAPALARAQAILSTDPGHPAANLAAGRHSFRLNKIEDGRNFLARAEQSYRALGNQEGLAARFVEEAEGVFAARRAGDVFPLVRKAAAEIEAARRVQPGPGLALLSARLGVVEGLAQSELGELDRAVETARRMVRETKDQRLGGTHLAGLLALARTFIVRNRVAEAGAVLDEVAEAAHREECERCLGMARYYRGYLASLKGDCNFAEKELGAAIGNLQAAGDQTLVFRARRAVCLCLRMSGQFDRAEQELAVLERDAQRAGPPDAMLQVLQEGGDLAIRRGHHARARERYEKLADKLRESRQIDAEHTVRLSVVQTHLWLGEFEAGEELLERVARETGREEWPNRDRIEVIRALFEIERDRIPAALARLDRLREAMRAAGRKGTSWYDEMTCEAAGESTSAERIRAACVGHWTGLAKGQSMYDPVRAWYSQSRWKLISGRPDEARQAAETAARLAAEQRHLPNELYSVLLLAEASPPRDPVVRQRLQDLRTRLDELLGAEGAKNFWRRATYSLRWNRLFREQVRKEH